MVSAIDENIAIVSNVLTVISHIPTLAMWCIFEALFSAACLMRDGCLPGEPLPGRPMGTIFHRDIKPSNGIVPSTSVISDHATD